MDSTMHSGHPEFEETASQAVTCPRGDVTCGDPQCDGEHVGDVFEIEIQDVGGEAGCE